MKKRRHINFDLLSRYLAGETSAAEQDEVKAWINVSDANRSEFDDLSKVWSTLGATSKDSDIDIDLEWSYLQSKIEKKTFAKAGKTVFGKFIRIAAAILILFGAAIIGIKGLRQNSIKTQYAEILETVLPDSSKISLNAGSKLTYDRNFNGVDRQVNLTGEAYFEIAPDSTKAFIISVNNAEIRVLGTSFNVKAYREADKIEVTVTEGRVSLYEKKQEMKMVVGSRGDKLEYNRKVKTVKKVSNSNKNFLSWKTRMFVFDNAKLNQVAETLEGAYHKEIVLESPGIGQCELSTNFENEELSTILKVIETTLDIKAEEKNGVIYLQGIGCE